MCEVLLVKAFDSQFILILVVILSYFVLFKVISTRYSPQYSTADNTVK